MELLLNDLSMHGQFQDAAAFRESIAAIMAMRKIAGASGREVYVHPNTMNCRVTQTLSMNEAVYALLSREQKISVLRWFTQQGPFWEDGVRHDPGDCLECNGELVTGTAVGEATCRALLGVDSRLVSFTPSNWEYSPLTVTSLSDTAVCVGVSNYWQGLTLETALQDAEPPIGSWLQLETIACGRFQLLTFSASCFSHLAGQSFAQGAAKQVISRLDVLNRMARETDAEGRRTPEGHRLYQDHFTGDRAWFSDSSDAEKNEFRHKLTFAHPDRPGDYLFCTWHGKVNTPKLRIHFAWPEHPGAPLYVTYIGLKITRQ